MTEATEKIDAVANALSTQGQVLKSNKQLLEGNKQLLEGNKQLLEEILRRLPEPAAE